MEKSHEVGWGKHENGKGGKRLLMARSREFIALWVKIVNNIGAFISKTYKHLSLELGSE